jgi:glyoxylate utilization-related uncharacterized protein
MLVWELLGVCVNVWQGDYQWLAAYATSLTVAIGAPWALLKFLREESNIEI